MSDEPPLSPDLSATLSELEDQLNALETDLASAREAAPVEFPAPAEVPPAGVPVPAPAFTPSAAGTEAPQDEAPLDDASLASEPAIPPQQSDGTDVPTSHSAPTGSGTPPVVAMSSPHARETAEALAKSLAEQLELVISSAEHSAAEIRNVAEVESQEVLAHAQERAGEEAARIRREAQEDAEQYLQEARGRIDAFAQERTGRISAVADRLSTDAQSVVDQLEEAAALRAALNDLLAGLTRASRAALDEARAAGPELPVVDSPTPANP